MWKRGLADKVEQKDGGQVIKNLLCHAEGLNFISKAMGIH